MMNNPSNMPQALDALKREIQKANIELQQKETALRDALTQKQALEASIKAKEIEIKQAKEKIVEAGRASRKLEDEVKKLKLEQVIWAEDWVRAGGRCFCLLQVADNYFLIDPPLLRAIYRIFPK